MSNGFEMCDKHVYLFATGGKDCPYCKIEQLEQELQKTQLQLMQEETDRKIWQQDCKNAEARLSRYQGAVEVEGRVECTVHAGKWMKFIEMPWEVIEGQRVRVLVMKEEE